MNYASGMGFVDQFDKQVSNYGTRSRTVRWPTRVGDFMIQASATNMSNAYCMLVKQYFGKTCSRRDFLELASAYLIEPYLCRRYFEKKYTEPMNEKLKKILISSYLTPICF